MQAATRCTVLQHRYAAIALNDERTEPQRFKRQVSKQATSSGSGTHVPRRLAEEARDGEKHPAFARYGQQQYLASIQGRPLFATAGIEAIPPDTVR